MADTKKPTELTSFAIEETGTGINVVPSITRLLNRQKLQHDQKQTPNSLPDTKQDNSPTSSQDASRRDLLNDRPVVIERLGERRGSTAGEPSESSHSPQSTPNTSSTPPKVRARSTRTLARSAVERWSPAAVAASTDPVLGAIGVLCTQIAGSRCLFLAITPPSGPGKVPTFVAMGAVADSAQVAFWVGFKWEPGSTPALWNATLKDGLAEIPLNDPQAKLVRTALGVSPSENAWFLRAGPLSSCRGVIVIICAKAPSSNDTSTIEAALKRARTMLGHFSGIVDKKIKIA